MIAPVSGSIAWTEQRAAVGAENAYFDALHRLEPGRPEQICACGFSTHPARLPA
jgi:hypothetical protein